MTHSQIDGKLASKSLDELAFGCGSAYETVQKCETGVNPMGAHLDSIGDVEPLARGGPLRRDECLRFSGRLQLGRKGHGASRRFASRFHSQTRLCVGLPDCRETARGGGMVVNGAAVLWHGVYGIVGGHFPSQVPHNRREPSGELGAVPGAIRAVDSRWGIEI